MGQPPTRPPVDVVLPFAGTERDADEVLRTIATIDLAPRDEIVLVDNTPEGVLRRRGAGSGLRVLHATTSRSSYYARNVGAEATGNPWILFLDSGCDVMRGDLLDAFFAPPIGPEYGIVSGRITGPPGQEALVARFARSRRHLDQELALRHPYRAYGATANLLVRREAWEQLGGFCERIRSAGDQDLCWRAQDVGWRLGHRSGAAVEHHHRETLRALARQFVRYGAGSAWLLRRHPLRTRRPPFRTQIPKALLYGMAALGRRDLEEASFRALDIVVVIFNNVGYLLDNRPNGGAQVEDVRSHTGLVCPEPPDEVSVGLHVEAERRPVVPRDRLVREHTIFYAEDDGTMQRALDATWLMTRSPNRSWRRLAALKTRLLPLAPPVRRLMRPHGRLRFEPASGDPRTDGIATLLDAVGVAAASDRGSSRARGARSAHDSSRG